MKQAQRELRHYCKQAVCLPDVAAPPCLTVTDSACTEERIRNELADRGVEVGGVASPQPGVAMVAEILLRQVGKDLDDMELRRPR